MADLLCVPYFTNVIGARGLTSGLDDGKNSFWLEEECATHLSGISVRRAATLRLCISFGLCGVTAHSYLPNNVRTLYALH